jgi:hypothetical protein
MLEFGRPSRQVQQLLATLNDRLMPWAGGRAELPWDGFHRPLRAPEWPHSRSVLVWQPTP